MTYTFDDCELDTQLFELRRNGRVTPVEPQVFDVLVYLVQNRDRVVTKDALLNVVWADRFVSDATLSSRIKAVRKAVGDDGRAQRVIRTFHGRGFRFVGLVQEQQPLPSATGSTPGGPTTSPASPTDDALRADQAPGLWGRAGELAQLRRLLSRALHGERQMVFVTGEAGMGKSTLVEAFLQRVAAESPMWIGRGQCIEYRGTGEAYLPVLDAIEGLCRGASAADVLACLERRAPTWLAQMPGLVEPSTREALQQRILGATRDRMLREIADALEELAAARALVLVLEDLHWSDFATLDLLAWLGRRSTPARLLVIGTYRPSEVKRTGHPLESVQQELRIRGGCVELALTPLDEDSIRAVLKERFRNSDLPVDVGQIVHARTEGNPLFVHTVLDDWLSSGLLVEEDDRFVLAADEDALRERIPETLQLLIEQQLARMSNEDVSLLEAACVAGSRFEAGAVAAATGFPDENVEDRCTELARRGQFIRESGTAEWPDGTVTACFEFAHGLYQEVLYGRTPPSRQARVHCAIGARLEQACGTRAAERATELAMHFMRGRDAARAVHYLRLAAEQAINRSAHREATHHLTVALEWLRRLPESPERAGQEVALQASLGSALIATQGWSEAGAERALLRACELSRQIPDPSKYASIRCRLAALYEYRGQYAATQALLEDEAEMGGVAVASNELLACSTFHQGKFRQAVEYVEKGLAAYDPERHRTIQAALGEEPAVSLHDWAGLALWFMGYPDRALGHIQRALAIAQEPDRTFSLAHAHMQAATLFQLRLDVKAVRDHAAKTIALAEAQGFAYRTAVGKTLLGWALCMEGRNEEGLVLFQDGLEAHRETGAEMDRPYYLALLADAVRRCGRLADSLAVLEEALGMVDGERTFFYESELHRMRGVLHLASGATGEGTRAAEAFRRALDVARRREARLLELRAATELARFYLARGDRLEARGVLAPTLEWFTEGFDTHDLVTAQSVLAMTDGGAPSGLIPMSGVSA